MPKPKYLKEIDLDAPLLEKGLRSEFRYQTRCISSLYERFLRNRVEIGNIWKILIEVVPTVTEETTREALGVMVVQIPSDPITLLKLPDLAKKELTLDLIELGVKKLTKLHDIDAAPFRAASQGVRRAHYVNERIVGKAKSSPDRRLKASLVVEHHVDRAVVKVKILSDSSVLREEIIAVTKPDELHFDKFLGSLSWASGTTVVLISNSAGKFVVDATAGALEPDSLGPRG